MWAVWTMVAVSALGTTINIFQGLAGTQSNGRTYGASDVFVGMLALALQMTAAWQLLAR